jgi:hypothetical protein
VVRRSNKENTQISTITSEREGSNRHNSTPTQQLSVQQQQLQQQQQQQQVQQQATVYDNNRHTQVKTYTDNGNGHALIRTSGSSHYSKVSCVRR